MKILVIDTEYNEVIEHEADKVSLHDYYNMLHCDLIDATTRVIGDDKCKYTIVCDDEGLLKDKRVVSAWSSDYYAQFVNSIAITRTDENGEDIGLTDEDVDYIEGYILTEDCWDEKRMKFIPSMYTLTKVDYPM